MEVVKTGLFRAAYCMYANTSVGYFYHSHTLAIAEKKFKSIERKPTVKRSPSHMEMFNPYGTTCDPILSGQRPRNRD